jgi:hypothetical protein
MKLCYSQPFKNWGYALVNTHISNFEKRCMYPKLLVTKEERDEQLGMLEIPKNHHERFNQIQSQQEQRRR